MLSVEDLVHSQQVRFYPFAILCNYILTLSSSALRGFLCAHKIQKAGSVAGAIYKHLDAVAERKKTDAAGSARKEQLHGDMPQTRWGLLL
jgi:hypothetical protein